jgi:hypothetical protein
MSGEHPLDEDLVMLHYGEADDQETLAAHVASCESCRLRRETLVQMLAFASETSIPERGEDYGEAVWRKLQPRLSATPRPAGRLLVAFAFAASIVVAFLVGRSYPTPIPEVSRERVFLAGVEDHLDRSQRVLVELSHVDPQRTESLEPERRLAEDLVLSNRLFRQTAARSGDKGLEKILGDLERVLLEIENSPEPLAPVELKALQKRVDALLFKVRVVGSTVKQRKQATYSVATS